MTYPRNITYDNKIAFLELAQRKASLLIQGMSFFMTVQREAELREKVIQEYKSLLNKILEVKDGVTDEEIEKEETPVGSTDTGLGEPESKRTDAKAFRKPGSFNK